MDISPTINSERLARIEVTSEHVQGAVDDLNIKLDAFDLRITLKFDAYEARITRLERVWIWTTGVCAALALYFKQLKGLL